MPHKPGQVAAGQSRARTNAVSQPKSNITPRAIAVRALGDVFHGGAFASQALDRHLSVATGISDEDKRLVAAIFYTCIENRLKYDYVLDKFVEKRPDPLIMDLLYTGLAQLLSLDRIPDHAAVNETVELSRKLGKGDPSAFVNGVLHSVIRMREQGEIALPDKDTDLVQYLSTRYSYAPDIVSALVADYGAEEAERLMAYVPGDRSSLCVRRNPMQLDKQAFENLLDGTGLSWTRSAVDDCYRVRGFGNVEGNESYRRGLLSVQGESSVLAAKATGVKRGMQVLDCCAAPGGKSAWICEQMQGTGRVYSWDVSDIRTDLIRAAARRLRLDNIRVMTRDARTPYPDFEGLMDVVLVDAPCSGLGVAGDKPDIKYRLQKKDMDDIAALQSDILDACAAYVAPGGLLVYSTCTVLKNENTLQMDRFLARHPEFVADPDPSFLPACLQPYYADGRIQILPDRDKLDGFFIGRMRRRRK